MLPENLGALAEFSNVRPGHWGDLMNTVANVLGRFRSAGLFNQPVPFFQGQRFDDVFGFIRDLQNALTTVRFTSAQDLAAQLTQRLGGTVPD